MYLNVETGKTVEEAGMALLEQCERARAETRAEFIALLPLFGQLERLPSWSHILTIIQFGKRITLYLKAEHQDSSLPREIAQKFHATGYKESGTVGGTLAVRYDLPLEVTGELVNVAVTGYLPKTCRVEYVEEFIPAHYSKVPKVVCPSEENGYAASQRKD